jgi:hypothetical protein
MTGPILRQNRTSEAQRIMKNTAVSGHVSVGIQRRRRQATFWTEGITLCG